MREKVISNFFLLLCHWICSLFAGPPSRIKYNAMLPQLYIDPRTFLN